MSFRHASLSLSSHAAFRMRQRGVTPAALALAHRYGSEAPCSEPGRVSLIIDEEALRGQPRRLIARLWPWLGLNIVITESGDVVTVIFAPGSRRRSA